MYRCRRFIAIILSLAVIASFFSFPVFGNDNDNVTQGNLSLSFSFSSGGGSVSLDVFENSLVVFKTTPTTDETFPITIKSLTWTNLSNQAPSNTFVSFKIAFAQTCSSTFNYFSQTSNFGAINTELGSLYQIYDTTYDSSWYTKQSDYSLRPHFKLLHQELFVKAQFKQPRTLSFNSTANFRQFPVNGSDTAYLYIIIYDVQILPNVSWFFSELLGFQQSILTQMLNLVDYTLTFLQRLTEQRVWTVTEDYFDEYGNFFSGQEKQTSWYTAIYQLLSNLYAPVKEQSEQEQRARDAGALDALDDAYDKAEDKLSFLSFLDLIDIGDIGEYDDDALGDAGSDSIIDWFSNATKNDIEGQVINALPRDEEHEVIDFYSQNIEQIQNYFGGG